MVDPSSFAKLVPGFDFLESLAKNAGSAMPGIGQWVAPTLNADELDKRIGELRTVQYWLEQNARMLGATIQALEVQRMTLSTLKTMNVQMNDLRDAMMIPPPAAPAAAAKVDAEDPVPPKGAVDPMQWWGALTKQFTELAAAAIKDSAALPPEAAAVGAASKPAPAPAAKRAAKKKAAPRRSA